MNGPDSGDMNGDQNGKNEGQSGPSSGHVPSIRATEPLSPPDRAAALPLGESGPDAAPRSAAQPILPPGEPPVGGAIAAMAGPGVQPGLSRLSFRGSASEYFGIWIVNILLTIVTFGVYSSWAKVRRMRYLYGSTELMNHTFDYHARGINIFLGRLIVFAILIVVNVISTVSPIAAIIAPILFLIALPWLIMRSLRFNARVTSYRNVRFDFVGKTKGAFFAVLLGSLVTTFSLGLLAPLAARWYYRYVMDNLRYGDRPFSTHVTTGTLYRAWVIPAVMVGTGLLIFAAVAALVLPGIWATVQGIEVNNEEERIALTVLLLYGILIPIIVIYLFAGIIWRIALRNAVLSASLFDGRHAMMSDAGRLAYLWIIISNIVVTLLTFGLMRPWAAVREWRYLATHTGLAIDGDPGVVNAAIEAAGNAATAEYLDLEGFDFGF